MRRQWVIVVFLFVMLVSVPVLAAEFTACSVDTDSACLNPGMPCQSKYGEGVWTDLGPDGPCACDWTAAAEGGGYQTQGAWDIGGDPDCGDDDDCGPDDAGSVNYNVEVMQELQEGGGGGGGGGSSASIADLLLTDPDSLIGSTLCGAQTSAVTLTHNYGESWGLIPADVIDVDDTGFCVRVVRRAVRGEICDPGRWLYVEVSSVSASHDGFAPNGLMGLSTGRVEAALDPVVVSSGFVFTPVNPDQEPWVQLRVHTEVSSPLIANTLPGFDSIPAAVTILGKLVAGPQGEDRLAVVQHKLDAMTPSSFAEAIPSN